MRVRALTPDDEAVAASRAVKPSIAARGRGDIPIRHELELELDDGEQAR